MALLNHEFIALPSGENTVRISKCFQTCRKSLFSELRIQTFCQISFLTDSGTIPIFHSEATFRDCAWLSMKHFEILTVFSPYRSATNLCLKSAENRQFFIFRKSNPKLTSYFKMSKKTHSWPNLSSFEVLVRF